ncbi:MAG: DUF615 domain-containing protein [Gammaproteobacteria bacterium]|nr:DUF615 domain-containing protein [Gammaproteobacteria bacterium]
MHNDRYEKDADDETLISKSQLKREADELFELGKHLVALAPGNLQKIPLDNDLHAAIIEASKIRAHGALKRQQQYIAKLLRKRDVSDIRAALEQIRQQSAGDNALFKQCERWRERLLSEDDTALQAFIDKWPNVDRQQLRQLIRNAKKEIAAGKPPKSSRELFRLIRDSIQE